MPHAKKTLVTLVIMNRKNKTALISLNRRNRSTAISFTRTGYRETHKKIIFMELQTLLQKNPKLKIPKHKEKAGDTEPLSVTSTNEQV